MEETTNLVISTPKKYGAWRAQKYYASKHPISGITKLYLSVALLIDWFGLNEKTLRNGISKFLNGVSHNYYSFKDNGTVMVDYDTLPRNCKTKRKLPRSAQDTHALLKAENEAKEDICRDREFQELKASFEDLYYNRWPKFLEAYKEKIADPDERQSYAKTHALFFGVLDAVKSKWAFKTVFEAVRQIMVTELDAHREPLFYSFNHVYFGRKVSKCRRFGIAHTLIHEMRGVPREYRVKMTGQIKAFARIEFRKPKRLLISEILKRIFKRFGVELSRSSLKSLKKKSLDRNILEYDSNGKIWGRQNGLPKLIRFLAEAPGDQFQGDWYKLQFYCKRNNIVIRLWAYVVLDVFSQKIVGWALSEKCLASQAMAAFKMAFMDHEILPEEIIIDNDKVYKWKIFKRFLRRINNLGVITTKAYPNIPTWKAEIESCFAVMQKLHSAKPWYCGEDVKSKNTAGNPAEEFVKQIYLMKKYMPDEKEMIIEFGKMVNEYNAMTNDRKKKTAPQVTYQMYKSKHAIKLEEWMAPLLFWPAKTKKRIKNDGRIDLEIDTIPYIYQITKPDLLWTYKNTDVRMCYNPQDHSKVYVFERGTLKFIAAIELRMVLDRDNKKEVLKKHKQILREAQQYLKDARESDENLLKGVPTRGPIQIESLADKLRRRRLQQLRFEKEVSEVQIEP